MVKSLDLAELDSLVSSLVKKADSIAMVAALEDYEKKNEFKIEPTQKAALMYIVKGEGGKDIDKAFKHLTEAARILTTFTERVQFDPVAPIVLGLVGLAIAFPEMAQDNPALAAKIATGIEAVAADTIAALSESTMVPAPTRVM